MNSQGLFHQVPVMQCNICIYDILVVAIHDTCLILFCFIVLFCRDICCIFSSVKMADVVHWLLKAFVLSRESPSLVQEVCYVMLSCAIVLWTTYNAQWILLSLFFITVRLPFSLIIRYILAILLVASVLKSELPIACLPVTCVHILAINYRFLNSTAFGFS